LVWLATHEAETSAAIIGLRSEEEIQRYEASRRGRRAPAEAVLYPLVVGRYADAEAALQIHRGALPEYLSRVLEADLAKERFPAVVPTQELVALYQRALDAQPSNRSRTIIKLRIRQLRYGQ
jgi:hypothetical protein